MFDQLNTIQVISIFVTPIIIILGVFLLQNH
ncbi:hypothetical protein F896_01045 [Acinetobacter genomosp. 15BJ]|uniref:Uncharacterized protein n=1 Tax=Acinetobacter genomosp. 15BJ TaxID=106651 RepID=R9B428_9GAMM|nr:hypothetical protein F896_01045 [Acinetobacter genomosp. 15BJ]